MKFCEDVQAASQRVQTEMANIPDGQVEVFGSINTNISVGDRYMRFTIHMDEQTPPDAGAEAPS